MQAPPPPSYDDSLKKQSMDQFTNPGYPGANPGYAAPSAPYQGATAPYPPAAPYPAAASAPYPPAATYQPPNTGYNNQYSAYPSPAGDTSYNLQFGSPKPEPQPMHGGAAFGSGGEEGGFTAMGFNDKNVRRLFIRKVFVTLFMQLLVTTGVVCLFTFHQPTKLYIREHAWVYYIAYVVFLSLYITLVCCESVRRKHPQNIILLAVFTLAFSYMTGTIASFYDTKSVVIALGTTAGVCLTVTVFASQTKYDFTKCAGVLFVLSMVLFLFGFITIFTYNQSYYIDIVYGCLGALVFTLFLAFDVQLVMGGKKHELGPEEHILGAILLYIDVVYIFLFILSIFGRGD